MSKGKVYIAGPMRGYPRRNFPAFDRAQVFFESLGYEVINPANMDRADADHAEDASQDNVSKELCRRYAERDCAAILGCTHIAMLQNWGKSIGATAEYHLAKWLQLEVLDAVTGDPLRTSPLLVGLCGYAQVGKSVIANQLGYPQAAFAAHLKDLASPVLRTLGLDVHNLQDKIKSRPILVGLGAVARAVDPMYWIKNLILPRGAHVIVITDVRYLNEVNYIMENDGIVFQIFRKGVGPANDEEDRSFNEIWAAKVELPGIRNDSLVEDAAEKIKKAIDLKLNTSPSGLLV